MERAPFLSEIAEGPEGGQAWWLHASDSTRIRIGVWPQGPNGTILLFPGRTEYIEKYGRVAKEFAARGFGVVAVDWRGQGLADRPAHLRDMGHVVSFQEYREDVAVMCTALDALGITGPLFLLGHSMGGTIGLRALHDGLQVAAAGFTGPMWDIRMAGVMRAFSSVVLGLSKPLGFDKTYAPTTGPAEPMVFETNGLTRDREMFDYMSAQVARHPELALGGPSLSWLQAALDETSKLMAMPAPDIPALTFVGTEERIVEIAVIKKRMATWPRSRLEIVKGVRHEVLMDRPMTRAMAFDAFADWFSTHSRS